MEVPIQIWPSMMGNSHHGLTRLAVLFQCQGSLEVWTALYESSAQNTAKLYTPISIKVALGFGR